MLADPGACYVLAYYDVVMYIFTIDNVCIVHMYVPMKTNH